MWEQPSSGKASSPRQAIVFDYIFHACRRFRNPAKVSYPEIPEYKSSESENEVESETQSKSDIPVTENNEGAAYLIRNNVNLIIPTEYEGSSVIFADVEE